MNVERGSATDQRCVMRWLVQQGLKPTEVHEQLCQQLGITVLSYRNVAVWCAHYRNAENSGRRGREITADERLRYQAVVEANREISIKHFAAELSESYRFTFRVLHKELSMRKICTKWIPHTLSIVQKGMRKQKCTSLLQQYDDDDDEFYFQSFRSLDYDY